MCVCPLVCRVCAGLRSLVLNGNSIVNAATDEGTLSRLPRLTQLDLGNNKLTLVPPAILVWVPPFPFVLYIVLLLAGRLFVPFDVTRF